jgi:TetR/AcrR family transcriptional regulator
MEQNELPPISSATGLRILDAASILFMQRGYKAVSINDIIRAAEVTKPTLYYHFADKEELFAQMGLRVLAEMGERLRAAAALPGRAATRLQAVATVLMADRDTDMRLMRHEMFEHLGLAHRQRLARAFFNQVFAPITAVMEQSRADGELAGHEPSTLAQIFMGMAEAFMEAAPRGTESSSGADARPFDSAALTPALLVNIFLHGAAGDSSANEKL